MRVVPVAKDEIARLIAIRESLHIEQKLGELCACDEPDCHRCKLQFVWDVSQRFFRLAGLMG